MKEDLNKVGGLFILEGREFFLREQNRKIKLIKLLVYLLFPCIMATVSNGKANILTVCSDTACVKFKFTKRGVNAAFVGS